MSFKEAFSKKEVPHHAPLLLLPLHTHLQVYQNCSLLEDLSDMINTFFAVINQLRFLQKISGFYQMGLHPDYRKDLYEQPLELLAALYWMCTCCP